VRDWKPGCPWAPSLCVCASFLRQTSQVRFSIHLFHPPEVSRGAGGCSGFRAAPARASASRKSLLLLLRRVGDDGGGRCGELCSRVSRESESLGWRTTSNGHVVLRLAMGAFFPQQGAVLHRAVLREELWSLCASVSCLAHLAMPCARAGRLDRSTSMIAWCVELDRPSARRCCAAGLAANASATPLSISTFSL
jgi:hypothetical protein